MPSTPFSNAQWARATTRQRSTLNSEYLSAENTRKLWISAGFSDGFLTISDSARALCKTAYARAAGQYIAGKDRDVAVDWPLDEMPQLSTIDVARMPFSAVEVFDA